MVFRYAGRFHPLEQLRTEVDRLFSGLTEGVAEHPWFGGARGQPAVNVWEKDGAFSVEVEVPGVKSDQIDISVTGNELTLKVSRAPGQSDGVTYHRQERPAGEFTRVVRLPAEVDPNGVRADLRDGVLTITLPQAAGAKPRKINVTAAS